MSKEVQAQINALKNEMTSLVEEKLKAIADLANSADLRVSIYYEDMFQNLHLVNKQFMQDYGWAESDLDELNIALNDWITSNQMDGY